MDANDGSAEARMLTAAAEGNLVDLNALLDDGCDVSYQVAVFCSPRFWVLLHGPGCLPQPHQDTEMACLSYQTLPPCLSSHASTVPCHVSPLPRWLRRVPHSPSRTRKSWHDPRTPPLPLQDELQ